MRDQLFAALATTPLAWFGGLSRTTQALVAVGVVFLAGVGLGAGGRQTLTEFSGHEERIGSLEQWRKVHEDTVTGPGLTGIGRLRDRTQDIIPRLEKIEMVLWCIQRETSECPVEPLNPYGGGQR